MFDSYRPHRGTWATDAFATFKIGIIFGAGRFLLEYVFGKFPSVVALAGVHVLYLALKYVSIRLYGWMGDVADRYFPPEKAWFPLRFVVHGIVLSLHIMPLYVISVLFLGFDFEHTIPGLTWYAGSNMLTGFATRQMTLRERRKRHHRK